MLMKAVAVTGHPVAAGAAGVVIVDAARLLTESVIRKPITMATDAAAKAAAIQVIDAPITAAREPERIAPSGIPPSSTWVNTAMTRPRSSSGVLSCSRLWTPTTNRGCANPIVHIAASARGNDAVIARSASEPEPMSAGSVSRALRAN